MFSISVYRNLLRLYPSAHREQFGEEMAAVFGDAQAEMASKSVWNRGVFVAREAVGILRGALQEHWRTLGGDSVELWFPTRRFTMRNRISLPENNRRIDDDHSGRSCTGDQEGRNDFVLPSESSDRTTPADTLRFVGGHLSNPCILLRRGNDRVGDSVRDATVGSASTSRNRWRIPIVARTECPLNSEWCDHGCCDAIREGGDAAPAHPVLLFLVASQDGAGQE